MESETNLPSLVDLPPEILTEILTHLQPIDIFRVDFLFLKIFKWFLYRGSFHLLQILINVWPIPNSTILLNKERLTGVDNLQNSLQRCSSGQSMGDTSPARLWRLALSEKQFTEPFVERLLQGIQFGNYKPDKKIEVLKVRLAVDVSFQPF